MFLKNSRSLTVTTSYNIPNGMRQFYETYPNPEIVPSLLTQSIRSSFWSIIMSDKDSDKDQGKFTIMAVRQPRYSKEEFAQRGDLIYQTQVRPQVEVGNYGKIVAINIETGAFEVADTPMIAVDRLYEREPDAQPWVIRIGHRAVFRFGSRSLRKPV